DFHHEDSSDGGNPNNPFTEQLFNWQLSFTSGLVPDPDNGSTFITAGQTLDGQFEKPFNLRIPASPDQGIGPGVSIAQDNTLGSFSPFQGRLYAAFVAAEIPAVPNILGANGDDTQILLMASDDGGLTWTALANEKAHGLPHQSNNENPVPDD